MAPTKLPEVCKHCNARYRDQSEKNRQCENCKAPRLTEEEDPTDFQIFIKKTRFKMTTPMFFEVFCGTWLVFLITILFFAYGYMNHAGLCWTWLALCMFGFVYLLFWHIFVRAGSTTFALCVGGLLALILGTLLGLYVYDTASIFPMFYHHSRTYTNVVASEPSAAIADAGKIIFSGDTRVDITKSAGYTREDGTVYCVAPIISKAAAQARVEYWAAGLNCCARSGYFTCDEVANPKAQAGVVVFDNNGWFTSARYPFYQQARAKAEAQHMLQSVGEPIFVRWVDIENLDLLENHYRWQAFGTCGGWILGFAAVSAALSLAMWQPRSMLA